MGLSVLGLFHDELPLTMIANLLQPAKVTGIVLGLGKNGVARQSRGGHRHRTSEGLTLSAEVW